MDTPTPREALATVRDFLNSQDIQFDSASPTDYDHDPDDEQGIEFDVATGSAVLWAESENGTMSLEINDYLDPNAPNTFEISPADIHARMSELVDRGLICAS